MGEAATDSGQEHPVVVTGCHRGGTTWIGNTIAHHPRLHYVHEPLNPQLPAPGRTIYDSDVWYKFQGLDSQNDELEAQYDLILQNKCDFPKYVSNISLKAGAASLPREVFRMIRAYFLDIRQSRQKSVCVKDPFALLHVGWLAKNFPNVRAIVSVRHPCAFALSLKRKGWDFPFTSFLNQVELLERFPQQAEDIERLAQTPHAIHEQAAVLWRLLFSYVDDLPQMPNIRVSLYEDVAVNPVEEFREIFQWLGLEMNDELIEIIHQDTSGTGPQNKRIISIDAKANVTAWRDHIGKEEELLIRKYCEATFEKFYGAGRW